MNKKAQVKMLLDIISNLKSIPTNKENGILFPDFYEVPEVKAVIVLLKHLKVDIDYLEKNGFVIATMLIGSQLKNKVVVKLDPMFARRKGEKWLKENGWSDNAIKESLKLKLGCHIHNNFGQPLCEHTFCDDSKICTKCLKQTY